MKKVFLSILAILLVVVGLVAEKALFDNSRKDEVTGEKVLNFYNWGDYIDPDLLTKFTKETGYKVNYQTFDSNEAMYTKIKQGGTNYDLTVPSDYMVDKMAQEGLLAPLDKSKITGMNNIDSRFLNQTFDPHNKYSVPYFWGTLGILYNKKKVSADQIDTWSKLWSPQFKKQIMLVDSARDILGMTLISQGKSVNDQNVADLAAAKGKLDTLMPNVKAIVADELKIYMAQGEASIGVTYSGEAAQAMSQNSDLAYLVPKDGSNEWFDNLVIPKNANHKEAAYALINFLNKPENAKQNAEYVGYATANQGAYALLPADEKSDPAFYPSAATLDRLQVYQTFNQEWTQRYNDAFLEFKISRPS
ncbi:Spermidine/putrescine-binding periplasmic protein (PotD) [Fructobacillus cardui]|uniref:ABC transporter substrate-binding protein n=1 Tax=Fructobacillus cardui TaxID=2893170 RepID=UPI002D9FE70C|nr:Spermidine/putrescine-binding periplasmic protein (PotD) [Fructobacillus cardui]